MLKNIPVRQSIFKTLITLAVSASILSGCAPAGLRSVSEENKDTSGTYDGQWVAVGVSTASTQRVGQRVALTLCLLQQLPTDRRRYHWCLYFLHLRIVSQRGHSLRG